MKKLQIILAIFAIMGLPLIAAAGPWQLSVDFHNNSSGKAQIISIISPGFEKTVGSAEIVNGKCIVTFTNEDGQLHIFRLAAENSKFSPVFFASNDDKLTLDYADDAYAAYAGNAAAEFNKTYLSIQKKEAADLEAALQGTKEIGVDSAELKLRHTISKNKLAESANKKIALIQSINDPVLSSYLAYKEVYLIKTGNIELYDKYFNALSKNARDTYWGKYVNDVINNFEAYQLLRQSKMVKPDELKNRYYKLPEAQQKSTFGRDIARELAP